MGHPYFNRDVGRDLNNDPYQLGGLNNQAQQLMNSQQNVLAQALYGYAGGGGQQTGCSTTCSEVYTPLKLQPAPTPKKAKSMFKEIVTDVKGFILEHRSVIYFLAFALLVDHFVFRGAFKARLQGCVDRLVTKVEEKIQ